MVDDTRRERDTDRQAKSEMPKSNDADFGVDRDSPKPSEAAESATEMPKPSPKMPNVSKLEDKHEARKQDPLNYALGKLDNMADQIRKTLENRPKFDEPVDDANNKDFFDKVRTVIGAQHGGQSFSGDNATYFGFNFGAGSPSEAQRTSAGEQRPPADLPWPECAFASCGGSMSDLAFLVAAAVLDGQPLNAVRAMAENLWLRLTKESQPPSGEQQNRPPWQFRPLSALMECFHVSIVRGKSRNELPIQQLKFKEPSEAQAVLVYAWSHLTDIPNWVASYRHSKLGNAFQRLALPYRL